MSIKSLDRSWYSELLFEVGVAILAIVCAIVVREVFLAALGTLLVWVTFYPAVTLVALYGGWLSGLAVALSSCPLTLESFTGVSDDLIKALEVALTNLDMAAVGMAGSCIAQQNPALASRLKLEAAQFVYSNILYVLIRVKASRLKECL